MFIDIVAVLMLTFLSALGLITVSDWLMGKALCGGISAAPFLVVDVSSIKENDLESAVRYLITGKDFSAPQVFLDCRNASESAAEICERLCRRFGCEIVESDEELCNFVIRGLHEPRKSI